MLLLFRRLGSARCLAQILLGGLLWGAVPAQAVEREHRLGGEVPLSLLRTDGLFPAVGLGLHYTYGVSDMILLGVEGDLVLGGIGPREEGRVSFARLTPGVTYVVDVLQWVPSVSLWVGPYALSGVLPERFGLDVVVGAALDYTLTRNWSVGVAYRRHTLLRAVFPPQASLDSVAVRVDCLWGW